MRISENIRGLVREGLTTAEIARRLGIRYQHAYNVLKSQSASRGSGDTVASEERRAPAKAPLSVDDLIRGGFELSGRWILSPIGGLEVDRPLPIEVEVYAFAKDGIVLYVGVATVGLAKRLYFYRKPGIHNVPASGSMVS